RAAAMAARVEVAEALSRELSQPCRLPRGLYRIDRQADRWRTEAGVATHRRLLVSARRHPDRRVLADWPRAEERLDSGSGRCIVPRARVRALRGPLTVRSESSRRG